MNIRHSAPLFLAAALLVVGAGCETTKYSNSPSTYDQGGGALMTTNIISPQANQTYPAGKDIPIEVAAIDMSGVNQVVILINGKQVAKDTRRPYRAVLVNPAPGQYAIQSIASNLQGDSKLSPAVIITVK